MPKSFVQGATRVEVIVRKDGGVSDENSRKAQERATAAIRVEQRANHRLIGLPRAAKPKSDDRVLCKMAFNNAKR